jgi:hypothetical protein
MYIILICLLHKTAAVVAYGQFLLLQIMLLLKFGAAAVQGREHVVANSLLNQVAPVHMLEKLFLLCLGTVILFVQPGQLAVRQAAAA